MLTADEIQQTLADVRAMFPGADLNELKLLQRYTVAQEIIIRSLGAEWWVKNTAGVSGSNRYFRTSPQPGASSFEHQDRVIELADMLWDLRELDGFDQSLKKLQTEPLEQNLFELRVAKLIHRGGHRVRFVIPTGIRGTDFDLAADIGGTTVAVEVKCKVEETDFTPTTTKNTLESARTQLPASGPGIIALGLKSDWLKESSTAAQIEQSIGNALRNTSRVNGVLAVWEQWSYAGDEAAKAVFFRWFENVRARVAIDGLNDLVRRVKILPDPGRLHVPVSYLPD